MAPSLSLPASDGFSISTSTSAKASGAEDVNGYVDCQFALSPSLSLPPAFGSTYVGETFACALCVNNELRGLVSDHVGNEEG